MGIFLKISPLEFFSSSSGSFFHSCRGLGCDRNGSGGDMSKRCEAVASETPKAGRQTEFESSQQDATFPGRLTSL